jgi:heme/copper-type cytochrome/quinol oxidase subunit 4
MASIEYLLMVGIIVFIVSIPFFMYNRENLEEQGFQVKQILINCVLGIILLVAVLIARYLSV